MLAGAALILGTLAYIGHVRKVNVRLTAEVVSLKRDKALLEASGKLALELTRRQTDARAAIEPKLEKLKHELLTRPRPKLPPECDRNLDSQRDALRWLQRELWGGRDRTARPSVQAAPR